MMDEIESDAITPDEIELTFSNSLTMFNVSIKSTNVLGGLVDNA